MELDGCSEFSSSLDLNLSVSSLLLSGIKSFFFKSHFHKLSMDLKSLKECLGQEVLTQNQGFQNQPFQVPNNHVQQEISNKFSNYKRSNDQMMRNMQSQINSLKGEFKNEIQNTMKTQQTALMNQQNAFQNNLQNMLSGFFQNQASTLGTLPSNTIPNPKGEMKAITTRSGVAYEGPSIPTNPSPKRLESKENTFQIFQDCLDISFFADALLLMPRFAPTIKSLLMNKEKFLELAKIPLNENCSAMLLKKLPEKLGDPSKFLIPCDFLGMNVCHALADLGASINLMPLSIWKKLSLPELTPMRMTLELVDRSITHPKGLAEDVFVKVGSFHFPTDFVVVDFEADPRVPLILGRSFLRTGRALIDVYEGELILRDGDEKLIFHVDKHPQKHANESIKMINFIDVLCEDSFGEVLRLKKSNHFLRRIDINPLFKEILKDVESKDSNVSNFDEDECFDPGGKIDKIDVFMNAYNDSEGDVLEILHNTTHNLFPEVFFDHEPQGLKDEPTNDDLMTEDKVFDPGFIEKIFFPSYVRLSSKDRHYLFFTIVFSFGSEDTIFDPGIYAFHFSSLEPVVFKRQMEVYSSNYFISKDE
ncbi:reverse transcriptase domain-containing protein [Tanacetum coccineum]